MLPSMRDIKQVKQIIPDVFLWAHPALVLFSPNTKLRSIGDELCDRFPAGDDVMLSLLAEFSRQGKLESILSNHTSLFIRIMEYAMLAMDKVIEDDHAGIDEDDNAFIQAFTEACSLFTQGADQSFYASIHTLQRKLACGYVSPAALISDYLDYVESLRAFSYDTTESGESLIYSHASTSRYVFCLIALEFNEMGAFDEAEQACFNTLYQANEAAFSDENDEDAANACSIDNATMLTLIDLINNVVFRYIQALALSSLLFDEQGNKRILMNAIENRDDLDDRGFHNIHGHDTRVHGPNHESLDDYTGKGVHTAREDECIAWHRSANHPNPEQLVRGLSYNLSYPSTARCWTSPVLLPNALPDTAAPTSPSPK